MTQDTENTENTENVFAYIGNPFSGAAMYGPFDTHEDAIEWAQGSGSDCWHVIEALKPD